MKKQRGQFITIEGSEGVGKSTNLKFIESYLIGKGIDLIVTREPGGTPFAEEIRDLLLRKREESVDNTAELLLVFAARAQHINQRLIPALESGKWVLCDRFTDSTYAYQGGGRRIDVQLIQSLELMVLKDFQPDLTFYLDIDVRLGLSRANKRAELDRFETEKIDFFERVRMAFLDRIDKNPSRYCVIDAGQALEKVQADILNGLATLQIKQSW